MPLNKVLNESTSAVVGNLLATFAKDSALSCFFSTIGVDAKDLAKFNDAGFWFPTTAVILCIDRKEIINEDRQIITD